MSDILSLRAYAKINIGLDVLRKRPDGYHDLKMIMQTIKLYDTLNMRIIPEDKIVIHTNLSFLPTDEGNLVYRAISEIKKLYSISKGVYVHLYKHIPLAAGLAGGSSDCAAALVGMNQLFNLYIKQKELMKIGASLGSDIPFCIMRGTALSEGVGDLLTPLPGLPSCYILVVKPVFSMSTKFVYENLVLDDSTFHPDIDGMCQSLREQNLKGVVSRMGNVLENVTVAHFPEIQEIKEDMVKCGAIGSLMSGSGSIVFGIFTDIKTALRASVYLQSSHNIKQVDIVRPFNKQIT